MFSGWTRSSDSKETELGSSDQEAFLTACKNTRMVLVPCWVWKCVFTVICVGLNIPEVLVYHLLRQISSQ